MDTSATEIAPTDALGRRTGPRRQHTLEEKRRIVEETHVRGASVATVARGYQLNANQVFTWRQLYRQGLLQVKPADGTSPMLPVKVSTPTVLPMERAGERAAKSARREHASGMIEIELSNGHRVRVHGAVDAKALKRVIAVLVCR
jgi:transposase